MKIPILMYHSISDGIHPLSVSISNFDKQMKFMKNNSYKSINFEELDTLEPKNKYFIITFDDGYEDVFINALPILKKYNFSSICFFVTDYIGKHNIWDDGNNNFAKLKLMDIEKIKIWNNNGMSVGAHTVSHKNLKNLSHNEKYIQIIGPKKFFNTTMSIDIAVFSYPFGSFDKDSIDIVKKNYRFAVTTKRSRFITNKFSQSELPRIPLNKTDNMFKFFLKIKTIYEDIKYKN
jgi:peptidoglycan/xylan/chitin deacetylase (PgdA/CDA1 family)